MNNHDQVIHSLEQSPTPSLISRAVIADTGFELSLEPVTGSTRKLRVRPHTENRSWWLVEHTQNTDGGWRVVGVEPLTNAGLTALAAAQECSNE